MVRMIKYTGCTVWITGSGVHVVKNTDEQRLKNISKRFASKKIEKR